VGYKNLKHQYKDKTLKELNISANTGVIVLGVKDNLKGLIPGPSADTLIGEDDYLIVLGSNSKLKHFIKDYTNMDYNDF
jgi:voltage-gated potassium channel